MQVACNLPIAVYKTTSRHVAAQGLDIDIDMNIRDRHFGQPYLQRPNRECNSVIWFSRNKYQSIMYKKSIPTANGTVFPRLCPLVNPGEKRAVGGWHLFPW